MGEPRIPEPAEAIIHASNFEVRVRVATGLIAIVQRRTAPVKSFGRDLQVNVVANLVAGAITGIASQAFGSAEYRPIALICVAGLLVSLSYSLSNTLQARGRPVLSWTTIAAGIITGAIIAGYAGGLEGYHEGYRAGYEDVNGLPRSSNAISMIVTLLVYLTSVVLARTVYRWYENRTPRQ